LRPTHRFLITCEHGGNRIPPSYRHLFQGHEDLLASHRGYDPGALTLARDLVRTLAAPLFLSTTSRLLIDLNRSPGHPRLYSEATRPLPAQARREIMARYYLPYRHRVEGWVAEAVARGKGVIHLSAHSFTPVLAGEVRKADVGLLYDPARPGELSLCRDWQAALRQTAPGLRVRRNYPYTGRSDGLTAQLRRRFPPEAYVGIELEVNQAWVFRGGRAWRDLRARIVDALKVAQGG
jgi:predicted N-formylglutamate amidohydrolase